MAINLNPNKEKYYNQRGIYYGIAGAFQKALSDFSTAIDINKDYSEAWSNRGFARFNLFDFEGSLKDLSTSIDINPSSAQTYYVRGLVEMQLSMSDCACNDFRKADELGMKGAKEKADKICGQ